MTEYDVTNISGTQPRKNTITMGKVDTYELILHKAIDMDQNVIYSHLSTSDK